LSPYALLIPGPRWAAFSHGAFLSFRLHIHRSYELFRLPGRHEEKTSMSRSLDRHGQQSWEPLLTFGPMLAGLAHGEVRDFRVVTQMSSPPWPPGRSEENNSVSPSSVRKGVSSLCSLFTTGPRFTATDHSQSNSASFGLTGGAGFFFSGSWLIRTTSR